MPWARLTYERTMEVYKELLKEMVLDSRNNYDLTVNELLVRAEIFKHNFTKRQLNILSFIITFTYPYGKSEALIPKLQDFEIAGISKRKIREELDKLCDMKVITWNKEENLFGIREPRFWDAPFNVGYNDDRSRELFFINLRHAGVDTTPLIEKLKNME